jgi:hypothetical protein
MKNPFGILFAALLAVAAQHAAAAPAAVVEGVQMPAWVERAVTGGIRRIPLAPGMELRGGDEVKTGAGSRIYIKLAEGSLARTLPSGCSSCSPTAAAFSGRRSMCSKARSASPPTRSPRRGAAT